MEVLSQIFYFIIIIGVLVLVHELGHFLAAKLFRMRVERFSIGFPPRAFGRKIGETDYCVSWLPIGGYVKIAGMIDESLDTGHLAEEAKPWEFRAKPVWQRVIVISAGVIMNVVLAVLIFWGLNLTRGKINHPITTVGHVQPESMAAEAGLQPGDRLIAINGEPVRYFEDIDRLIAYRQLSEDVVIELNRGGAAEAVHIPRGRLSRMNEERFGVYAQGMVPVIDMVEPGKPAHAAGLTRGDAVLALNDSAVHTSQDVVAVISGSAGTGVLVRYLRDGKQGTTTVTPNEDGKIGIKIANEIRGPVIELRYGVFEALTAGVGDLANITSLTIQNIWHIIIGKASFRKSIGGPVRIAEMAAQQAEIGIASFLGLMAILSISLAIINILPFPALDGGHLIFLVYEAVFRREVPNKIRIFLQQAGMVLLLAFMIFVIYNDIFH